jgi:glycosyltransferase involved in cell wall biosynthesis
MLIACGPTVRVAYLVNQYPTTSHSFIRREIHALEAQGVEVLRFTLRRSEDKLVSDADHQEVPRTRAVLQEGARGLLQAMAAEALRSPARFARALARALELGRRSDRGVGRHLAYFASACVLVRWLRSEGAQHLHAHFGTNPAAVALLARELGGPPYSFTVHGPEEFDKPEPLKLREKVRRAAFTVAISSYGRAQLSRWARYEDWAKLQVVRCGLDEALIHAPPTPVPDAPKLVCVARISEQKGHLLLVEAASRLASDGVAFELTLVGDGPMRREVEALIDKRGLKEQVRIAGWMSGDDVRKTILSSRAMVLPSFAEGLPVVLMEALALGRPVVTTAIAGIPELVESGKTGWLVPAGSVEALVTALKDALKASTVELETMGREGARRVARLHDARVEASKLATLFRCASEGDVSATVLEGGVTQVSEHPAISGTS